MGDGLDLANHWTPHVSRSVVICIGNRVDKSVGIVMQGREVSEKIGVILKLACLCRNRYSQLVVKGALGAIAARLDPLVGIARKRYRCGRHPSIHIISITE